jgi:hypothetical protein
VVAMTVLTALFLRGIPTLTFGIIAVGFFRHILEILSLWIDCN